MTDCWADDQPSSDRLARWGSLASAIAGRRPIITDAGTSDHRDFAGPYAPHHVAIERRGRFAMRFTAEPDRFARHLARAVEDRAPFTRHAVGPDARMLMVANWLLSGKAFHRVARLVMGIPPPGALRSVPSTESDKHG
ncbi:hypothetical protein [Mycobacterium marinum]|uniref:hypothetical protein n=1 Tax=Mycobacterium marinum TaxID=1781 RepID=UPI0035661271